MEHLPVYCKGCRLVVAPADPERVQKGLFIWHRSCLRREEQREEVEKRKLLTMKAYSV